MGLIVSENNVCEYVAVYEQLKNKARQVYADCNTIQSGHILQWRSTVVMGIDGWESIMESALEFEAGEYNDFCVSDVAQFFYDAETIHRDELSIAPSRKHGVACFINAKKETLDYIQRYARTVGAKAYQTMESDLRLSWD